jgi:hypothetical protein
VPHCTSLVIALLKQDQFVTGAHQRFFRALCISLKVPRAIEICKQAVAEGKAVVIGLQTTGEASSDQQRAGAANTQAQREVADLKKSAGKCGGETTPNADALVLDCEDQEVFASAPALVLKRVIYKLFPLPPKPQELVNEEIKQREQQELPTSVFSHSGRRQRSCVTAYQNTRRLHEPVAEQTTVSHRGLKRKTRKQVSDDAEEFDWNEDEVESQLRGQAKSSRRSNKPHRMVIASGSSGEEEPFKNDVVGGCASSESQAKTLPQNACEVTHKLWGCNMCAKYRYILPAVL